MATADRDLDPRADLARLKAAANLALIVAETLPLKRQGHIHFGLCPFHGESTPSFYVYGDHYHCFGCGAHGDVFDWLAHQRDMSMRQAIAYLGGGDGQHNEHARPVHTAPAPRPSAPAIPVTLDFARRIWTEATSAGGTIVEAYLASRGLKLAADVPIRFHPACPRDAERLPAMLSLMTDAETAKPVGVHRTFLREDGSGKAPGIAKMTAGNVGIVRLSPDAAVTTGLAIAEGIETALTILQHTGWRPVWACTGTGKMRTFPVLGGIEAISIFADADDKKGAGIEAARVCADRWREAGREAAVHIPPAGTDWNDVAMRRAA